MVPVNNSLDNAWRFFSATARSDQDIIFFKVIYAEIVEDIVGGLMLSDLIYWFTAKPDGTSRLSVEIDGDLWLARSDKEFAARLGRHPAESPDKPRKPLSNVKQIAKLRKRLADLGLIKTCTRKFNGAPTTHYWLNKARFLELWAQASGVTIEGLQAPEIKPRPADAPATPKKAAKRTVKKAPNDDHVTVITNWLTFGVYNADPDEKPKLYAAVKDDIKAAAALISELDPPPGLDELFAVMRDYDEWQATQKSPRPFPKTGLKIVNVINAYRHKQAAGQGESADPNDPDDSADLAWKAFTDDSTS